MNTDKDRPRKLSDTEIIIASSGSIPEDGGAHAKFSSDRLLLSGGSESGKGNTSNVEINKKGTKISGKLDINTEPHNISIGMSHYLNDMMTSGIPSTTATPIPTLILKSDTRLMKRVMDTMKDADSIMQLIQGISI